MAKSAAGGRRPGSGRPAGSMNKDKARPYFATIKNAILKKNPTWIEEIEYTLSVMNDPNVDAERRDQARDTLLNHTYTKPQPAEMQTSEQLGFNLQWSDSGPAFDPSTVQATPLASDGTQLN